MLSRVFAILLFSAALVRAAEPSFVGPLAAGKMEAPPRSEASGLAISRRSPDILWTHDDSKGAPVLYAVDTSGKLRGSLRVAGTKNDDWEDLASFERGGKAWLLIADTGDNDAERDSVLLHVVEEPLSARLNPLTEISAAPAYSLRVRYEDGPRDCEGVAVDAAEGAVYLLTKRDDPPRLYRVPLGASREKHTIARFIGPVPRLAGVTAIDALFKHVAGKKAAWPTAFDISADGRMALVLTYSAPLVFLRRGSEPWVDAFQREPMRLLFHGLPQAEGACFSADGRAFYLVSETSAALVRYDREER